jgi:Putative diphthamide synthesis protein
MTSLFSSVETNSLERQVEVEHKPARLGDIWNPNDLNRCIKFLREGSFSRVCLQFSDEIINYSVEIEKQLKKHIDSNVFLLADTSYGSCCVDEVSFIDFHLKYLSNDFFFVRLLLLMSRLMPSSTLVMLAYPKSLDCQCFTSFQNMMLMLTSLLIAFQMKFQTKWKKSLSSTMLGRSTQLVNPTTQFTDCLNVLIL